MIDKMIILYMKIYVYFLSKGCTGTEILAFLPRIFWILFGTTKLNYQLEEILHFPWLGSSLFYLICQAFKIPRTYPLSKSVISNVYVIILSKKTFKHFVKSRENFNHNDGLYHKNPIHKNCLLSRSVTLSKTIIS